jgi:tripartite ATP-independent transporter DctP family solute receptor
MTRYRALAMVGAALMGLVPVLAATPAVANEHKLRISLQYPAGDTMVGYIREFAKKVEERSNGAITSEIFTDFTLFKQGQELPAIQRGNLDIAVLNTGDVEQQIPEYTIYSSGFLFRDHDHFRAVFDGEVGDEYGAKLRADLGVKVLGVLYGGTRHLNLREKMEVNGPADLHGVKLRMPGAPAWQTLGKGLGVIPTPMALGEVYLGLRTGAINGQENPLGLIRSLKIEEVTQQIVLTGHMVQAVIMVLSGETWDKLTPELQEIVATAARETTLEQDAGRLAQEQDDLAYLRSYGLAITETDREAFRASVDAAFVESGLAATWPEGLRDRIAAVQ